MLSAGVSVRSALVENIHIVSSLLVHMVLGVFFVVNTQPQFSESRLERHTTDASVASDRSTSSTSEIFNLQKKVVSSSAFMAIQPPQKKSNVTAKMSLAKSLGEHTQRRDRDLAGMLQSISFEKQTSAAVRQRVRNREDFASTSTTTGIAENIPEHVLETITNRFAECWTIPYDTQNPENVVVKINLGLDPHGKVTTASIADTYLYDHNPFYRAVADSALRAVHKCSPLLSLQAADYSLWNKMVLTFDTKHMSMS